MKRASFAATHHARSPEGRPAKSPAKDAEARQKFEKALVELDEQFKIWTDTIQDSERLREDDFAIRINARD